MKAKTDEKENGDKKDENKEKNMKKIRIKQNNKET